MGKKTAISAEKRAQIDSPTSMKLSEHETSRQMNEG